MEWKNQLQNLKENIIVQTHFDVNGDFSHNNIQLTESSIINYDDLTVQFNDDYDLSKAIEHATMQNYSFDYVDERTLQLYIKYDFDNLISYIHNLKFIEKLTTLTESDKFDKIRKAIRNKKLITFLYSGDYTQSTGVRVVEPYVLGTTLAGNKVIRAYQTSGSTDNPGDMPGWRMFLTKNISNIDVSETGFSGKRPGYNAQGDKGMINIELHSGKTRIGRQLD